MPGLKKAQSEKVPSVSKSDESPEQKELNEAISKILTNLARLPNLRCISNWTLYEINDILKDLKF